MAFITSPSLSHVIGRSSFCITPSHTPLLRRLISAPTPAISPTHTVTFPTAPSVSNAPMFNFSTKSTKMSGDSASKSATEERDPKTLTDAEWRERLTDEEYRILRQKGTEYPGTGEYDGFYPKEGHFACSACGNPIYSAASKFKSGCGWPAFDKCYKGSIAVKKDFSFGMRRVEIMCAKCDGHLGHVFEGERMTDTNERHCVNSVSVKYIDGPVDLEEEKLM